MYHVLDTYSPLVATYPGGSFVKFRFLWGAVDFQAGSSVPYSAAQTGTNLGTSAAPPGIGVRRASIVWDRSVASTGDDVALTHFDFLNVTGGDPDDTWIDSDYTTLEGYLNTWASSMAIFIHPSIKTREIRWYRHGPGLVAPLPAERVTPFVHAGSDAGYMTPPQCASTITFRTSVRRSWGRTYLPGISSNHIVSSSGRLTSAYVDGVAGYAKNLSDSAASSDFLLVVTSNRLDAVLNAEHVEVDDNVDIQRRRRWDKPTYSKIVP